MKDNRNEEVLLQDDQDKEINDEEINDEEINDEEINDEEINDEVSFEEMPSSSAEGEEKKRRDREEYEELIKNRFQAYYAEDMQKMVNRRFRKYKVLEEKYKVMEQLLSEKEEKINEKEQVISDFSKKMETRVEEAVKMTEARVLSDIRMRKMRPSEIGLAARTAPGRTDVAKLTRSERAKLAERAYRGEKIKL